MTELAVVKILSEDTAIADVVSDRVSLSYIPQNADAPLILCTIDSNDKSLTKDSYTMEDLSINVQSIAADLAAALSLDRKVFRALHNYDDKTAIVLSTGESITVNHSYQVATRSEWNDEINFHVIISTYRFLANVEDPQ